MGGLVAFEMARQLTAQGETVALVALLDVMAPQGRHPSSPDAGGLAGAFARDWSRLSGWNDPAGEDWGETEDEVLSALLARFHAAGTVPADLDLSGLRILFGIFSANYQALHGYTARPYAGDLVVFRAADRDGADASLGWRELAERGVEVHAVPGDHYSLIHEPQAETLAELLSDCIERICRDPEKTP